MTDEEAKKLGGILGGCLSGCVMAFFWMLLGGVLTYTMMHLGWLS